MADETGAAAAVDATKPVEESTRAKDAPADPALAEAKAAEGGDVAPASETTEAKPSPTEQPSSTDKPTATEDAKAETTTADKTLVADPSSETAMANGTPASSKISRRKSGAGVSEHNKKKTPSKKKKAVAELHLDAQPGQTWFVAMKGYPPWPVIICDEEMLPESLLSKRPVSAKRIDGTYREDFAEGGKNAKDRRYPVMFLGTNEFAWQVNTDLQPFVLEDIKKEVEQGNQTKKSKALWEAYEIAAEDHDLDWFKDVLKHHEEAVQADAEEKEAAAQKKQDKKQAKAKRQSVAAAGEDEDVDMEDAGDVGTASAKKNKEKKRKKGDESEGESEKPSKTPKVKLTQKPKDSSAAKPKKETKPKKAKGKSDSEEGESAKVEEKPLTEAERLEKREKSVLYLRHRLQKGFLSRDQAPKAEEMSNMSDYLKQLEVHSDLEAEVIKKTKVHKVLKAIIKLESIPREEEYQFKKRSNDLLNSWNRALAADVEGNSTGPTTNGVKHDEDEKDAVPAEAKSEETPAESEAPKVIDGDGDLPMAEAKDEASAVSVDPVSAAAAESTTETATA